MSRDEKSNRKTIVLVYYAVLALAVICFFYFGRSFSKSLFDNNELTSLAKNGKFLVLFQNNTEIRSSGGFIGSFATIDVQDFKVKDMYFNTNIYALDKSFKEGHYTQAPEPVLKMLKGQTWTLKDANYDVSFPDAALDILDFYTKETNDQADAVVALNGQVMIDLLKITGPIRMDKYDVTIDESNFYTQTQYKIEKDYYQDTQNWVINEPKTFLKDLYPIIISKAFDHKLETLKVIRKSLDQKEIVLYFKDSTKQAVAAKNFWDGRLLSQEEINRKYKHNSPVETLYVNANSYSGNKSSTSVKEKINYQMLSGGRVNLTLERKHEGIDSWPDGKNTTFFRVYVPKGARILSVKASNISDEMEINSTDEKDKTVFSFYSIVEPGKEQSTNIIYQLSSEYASLKDSSRALFVQKQPGMVNTNLDLKVGDKEIFGGSLNADKLIEL